MKNCDPWAPLGLPSTPLNKRLSATFIAIAIAVLTACTSTQSTHTGNPAQAARSPEHNRQWAEEFITRTSKAPDIKKAGEGVYYRELKSGYGCRPAPNSNITVHYEAALAESNRIVDSSYARGLPPTFPLSKMIAAWRTAIPMMNEGDAWELYVHPEQAYGSKGSLPAIPPNAAMKFVVSLIKADSCQHAFQRR
ncbi:MAG TPA: FKBP-type peptidyl-prolyl cis-trans isomerase [Marinagarivorans sp.]